ncbi:MAG: protoheme IX farnesyltransferase [gamma proteobacterium symbiont of Ctena orbiculata]|nr:heme o synthase [Candidatus Thiodiazotropha taylori]PUB87458.1 MAG: protoheme IX farnesyltransferase [gamma proteobacterium symbiont of Ctena orbiculata]MBT3034767.1 heme o synthase [Candidatus Thiodiazotropha taylori]PVV12106.1 MAG: protoheme IX farnesyltransferase [gamma proteobacterium symbiont of Ctena orbiculata]PVV12848.1 MAG: protoheme IX farnesyltransferase [gamma proteobacterium symbiont of Ctena orbiculata]
MAISNISTQQSVSFAWRHYYEMTKPKVVLLIAFTALVGMLLSHDGLAPLQPLLFGLLGISLAAASGAVINHVIDQRIDAMMDRTSWRPIPSGHMDTPHAMSFALVLGAISMLLLYFLVNPLTALLTFFALIGYAVVYTLYLKRNTPQNIVWGGLAGAAPPLLGWCAITGEVTVESFLLLLIIFIWTPPHFWPLAIHRRDDYAKADVPMLPVTHGIDFTKQQILIYTIMLLAVTLLPFVIQMSGYLYLCGALVLGCLFIYHAVKLLRSDGREHAMKTFAFSILYLSLLFTLLLADHYLQLLLPAITAS